MNDKLTWRDYAIAYGGAFGFGLLLFFGPILLAAAVILLQNWLVSAGVLAMAPWHIANAAVGTLAWVVYLIAGMSRIGH